MSVIIFSGASRSHWQSLYWNSESQGCLCSVTALRQMASSLENRNRIQLTLAFWRSSCLNGELFLKGQLWSNQTEKKSLPLIVLLFGVNKTNNALAIVDLGRTGKVKIKVTHHQPMEWILSPVEQLGYTEAHIFCLR